MPHAELLLRGDGLTIESLVQVARDPSVRIVVSDESMEPLRRCRAGIEDIVRAHADAYRDGKDEARFKVYGVTTGFGEFKKIDVAPDKLIELQRKILLSHAVGMGDNEDQDDAANYFPAEVVRAAIVLRVNTFLKGMSGVRPQTLRALIEMINRGVVPLVPIRGSVGSSGDLCPLAHLFATFLGEGRFYVVATASDVARGMRASRLRPAVELSAVLGISAEELSPREKEGLALTNGAAFSAAMLALAVSDAEELADAADAAASLTLEAICGKTRALDDRVHEARGLNGQRVSAKHMRSLVAGSRLADQSADAQDAYSVRCAPAVHGASRDAIAFARRTAEAEINAATDNPLFIEDSSGVYEAYSAGNFHGQPVGMAADFLAIAVAELANISERRTQMLLDSNHNRGLPPNLIAQPGLNSGFMIAQYTAAALVSENKILAHPACVDSIPTSANVEDHVAMATTAARKARTVLSNTRGVLAVELLVAAQAAEWRLLPARGAPEVGRIGHAPSASADVSSSAASLESLSQEREASFRTHFGGGGGGPAVVAASLGSGSARVYRAVRGAVPALVEDVYLEPLFRAARTLLAGGEIARIVRRT
jgi:histidine ammonia-lyase